MKKKSLFLLLIAASFAFPSHSENEKGIFVDFHAVEKVKKRIQQKDDGFLPAYTALMERADMALTEGPFSVMDKKRVPPSGDKHDYLSMGPYWWPDPSQPDSLPYMRKDGEVNPETKGDNVDKTAKSKMFSNVETLAWAFYFSGNKKYGKKAVELLETWFVNPQTRMHPNLNYAQGIPGRCEGRGIGIIDWAGINELISPIQLLEAEGMLTKATKTKLYSWFEDYLHWLTTSDYGKDEDDYFNNHGTHFDVQAVGIALFLGKSDLAKARLEQVKTKRIATQIEPDGSQPFELARTKSLSYSTMNLRGFIHLANMGELVGVDLWNFETADGRGIKKSLDFLLPFVQHQKQWEHQQINSEEEAMESLKLNYLMSAVKTGDKSYREVAQTMKSTTGLDILLYPLLDES